MATYPKSLKPWRGYPSANVIMGIRAHVQQVSPQPGLGQFALTKDVARHIGTVPAGAIILPAIVHVLTGFTAAVTIAIGPYPATLGVKDAILTSAAIAPQTIGFKPGLGAGVGMGFTANTLPLFLLAEAAVPLIGEMDVVIPFYIQRD